MGSGNPRSNKVRTRVSRQVLAAGGIAAISCAIDEIHLAEPLPDTPPWATGEGTLDTDGTEVWLSIGDMRIARLVPSTTTAKLVSCMRRGHTYVAMLVDDHLVRISNAL